MTANDAARLIGTWKQVSGVVEEVGTGVIRPNLSKAPNGYIHFAPDGRMFNMTTDSARQRPAGPVPTAGEAEALYRTLIAYSGRYTVSGDKVTFHVDVSWNESWNGTDQVRQWEIRDGRLHVSAHIVNPLTGKESIHRLVLEKETSR